MEEKLWENWFPGFFSRTSTTTTTTFPFLGPLPPHFSRSKFWLLTNVQRLTTPWIIDRSERKRCQKKCKDAFKKKKKFCHTQTVGWQKCIQYIHILYLGCFILVGWCNQYLIECHFNDSLKITFYTLIVTIFGLRMISIWHWQIFWVFIFNYVEIHDRSQCLAKWHFYDSSPWS